MIKSPVWIPCNSCDLSARCALRSDHLREALFAFGRGVESPDCLFWREARWHGVDGVLPLPAPRFLSVRKGGHYVCD